MLLDIRKSEMKSEHTSALCFINQEGCPLSLSEMVKARHYMKYYGNLTFLMFRVNLRLPFICCILFDVLYIKKNYVMLVIKHYCF